VLLSLVPTQLARLLACPEGVVWLVGCRLIWVGGASLPTRLAEAARAASLPLAPCYGATETAAMVCAQRPAGFLAGEEGCGQPLDDVALRVDAGSGAIEVRTARLSPGRLTPSGFLPLPLQPGGWWRSGDAGRLAARGLRVLGRLDGALLSGGETVFPERLEERLREDAAAACLPLEAVLLLGEADAEWGERLVALVRPGRPAQGATLLEALKTITAAWPAPERPRRWLLCPDLEPGPAGKWQRLRWRQWLKGLGP
jgi:O-succinylbenzoic acid--CoA ligase